MKRMPHCLAVCLSILSLPLTSHAAGLFQDGAGPRAKSMGGAGAAIADDPLSALFNNPAALASLNDYDFQLAADGMFEHGVFINRANSHATGDTAGAIGEFAASMPLGPLRLAIGLNPEMTAKVRWHYFDAPGGADGATTYGFLPNQSEIVVIRSALGVAWQVTPKFSIGASAGLIYNENQLQTAYVFQRQPVLRTVKTTLDLQTDGFGADGQFALRYQPIDKLSLSLTYNTPSKVNTHGVAEGNANVQLANLGLGAARPDFRYDAEVINRFPGTLAAGIEYKVHSHTTLAGEFDWIHWSGAFGSLPVHLTGGNNADINGLVGSNRLNDSIPLDWKDQYVGRFGIEQGIGEHWSLRAGYSFANNPVPGNTLLPLTASILEHLVTAGVGYKTGRWQFDVSYQFAVPATSRVTRTDIAAGEYANSSTSLYVNSVSLSARYTFGPRPLAAVDQKDKMVRQK